MIVVVIFATVYLNSRSGYFFQLIFNNEQSIIAKNL